MTSPQPSDRSRNHLVPYPVVRHIVTVVEEGQTLTPEQRERVVAWLRANGADPAVVTLDTITLEYKMFGTKPGRQFIGFQQYYTEGGSRVHAAITDGAVKFQRYVEQSVELEPDPAWQGWEQHEAKQAEARAKNGGTEA
ncbi:hypothetical protein [Streptomyces sp. NPDC059916]|uniref:hypothetical protein n=1 Tax=Streptomyces sp. NPDC059916 TaxID=3347001 RepID=UPI003694B365